MSAKSRRKSARRSAEAAANLATLPQSQALSQLLRATNDQYSADTAQTKSYAASVRANALSQVNPLRSALQAISDQQRADQATAASRLAAIGPGGAAYAGAAAREGQAANARLLGTQTGAVTELNSRASDALSGGQYALSNLATKHSADQQKIMDQIAGLAEQKGAQQAKVYQDTLQSLRSQDVTLHGQSLSHADRAASLAETRRSHDLTHQDRQAAANKKAKGKPKLSSSAQDKYRSYIGQVVSVIKSSPAKDDNGKPLNDHAIRQHLMNGQNPLKKVVAKEDVNVAMDLARLNYLSTPNRVYLKRKGVHPPRNWITKPGRRPPAPVRGVRAGSGMAG
jgi:hypothetical protein